MGWLPSIQFSRATPERPNRADWAFRAISSANSRGDDESRRIHELFGLARRSCGDRGACRPGGGACARAGVRRRTNLLPASRSDRSRPPDLQGGRPVIAGARAAVCRRHGVCAPCVPISDAATARRGPVAARNSPNRGSLAGDRPAVHRLEQVAARAGVTQGRSRRDRGSSGPGSGPGGWPVPQERIDCFLGRGTPASEQRSRRVRRTCVGVFLDTIRRCAGRGERGVLGYLNRRFRVGQPSRPRGVAFAPRMAYLFGRTM